MNVVDSSGWLEYFADGPNANFFAPAIENTRELIIPSISLYEVFKRILQQRSEDEALKAIAIMLQGQVIDLDMTLALGAAKTSTELKLPMAEVSFWLRHVLTRLQCGRRTKILKVWPEYSTSRKNNQGAM
jgi:hypothetical protein